MTVAINYSLTVVLRRTPGHLHDMHEGMSYWLGHKGYVAVQHMCVSTQEYGPANAIVFNRVK